MRPIPEVSDIEIAFPTRAMEILPAMKDIPDEFVEVSSCSWDGKTTRRCRNGKPGSRWLEVISDWFFRGLKDVEWTPKPGVDPKKALRAIQACMGDWSPSHEHKEAGCAFLLSEWFEDVKYQPAK